MSGRLLRSVAEALASGGDWTAPDGSRMRHPQLIGKALLVHLAASQSSQPSDDTGTCAVCKKTKLGEQLNYSRGAGEFGEYVCPGCRESRDTGTWNAGVRSAAELLEGSICTEPCRHRECREKNAFVARILRLLKPEGTSPKDCGCAPGDCAEDEAGAVKGWRCRIKADATEGYHDDGMDDWPDSGDTRSEDR